MDFDNASKINENGIAALYLTYGILAGLGIGIGYNAVISVVNEWFTDKKGTSSGALMMSFGASALVFWQYGRLADPLYWVAEYLSGVGDLLWIGITACSGCYETSREYKENSRTSTIREGAKQ